MSNIEKIRQEIERRKTHFNKEATKYQYRHIDYANNCFGARDALRDLLAFIDSLSKEPDKNLEESAEEYRRESYRKSVLPNIDGPANEYCGNIKDAFIAGAKWMRKKDVEDMYLSDNRHFLKCYEQGKVDMRVEMMKDAVEGEIGYWNQRGLSIRLDKSLERLGYDMDTKVKILIVKNDDGLHQTEEG